MNDVTHSFVPALKANATTSARILPDLQAGMSISGVIKKHPDLKPNSIYSSITHLRKRNLIKPGAMIGKRKDPGYQVRLTETALSAFQEAADDRGISLTKMLNTSLARGAERIEAVMDDRE